MSILFLAIRSFFDGSSYIEVATRKRLSSRLAIWLYLIFFAAVVSAAPFPIAAKFGAELKESLKAGLPDFTLDHQKLVVQAQQPLIIHPSADLSLVVDTTGEIASLDNPRIPLATYSLLFNATQAELRKETLTRVFRYSDFPDVTLTDEQLKDDFDNLGRLFPYLFVGLGLCTTLLFRAVSSALLAILASGTTGVPFGKLFRTAIFSLTPVLILESLCTFGGVGMPLMVSLLLGIGYFIFGARAVALTQQSQAR